MIIYLPDDSIEAWMIRNTIIHLEMCGYTGATARDAIRFLYEIADEANPER